MLHTASVLKYIPPLPPGVGRGMAGRFKTEGIYYIYVRLIHFTVQQKLTQIIKQFSLLFSR